MGPVERNSLWVRKGMQNLGHCNGLQAGRDLNSAKELTRLVAFTTNLGVLRAYSKPDPQGMMVFQV